MTGTDITRLGSEDVEQRLREELAARIEPCRRARFKRLLLAAMSAIPWVGGLISGIGALKDQEKADKVDELQRDWLEEHSGRFRQLGETLGGIMARLEELGGETRARIDSEEYLALVRGTSSSIA